MTRKSRKSNMSYVRDKDNVCNRDKTECIRGHEFTEENTRIRVTKKGEVWRVCIECSKARARAYYRFMASVRDEYYKSRYEDKV